MRLTRRHYLAALPALGAAGLGGGFLYMLRHATQGTFDPKAVRNPRLGQAVPAFSPLPALPEQPTPCPGLSWQDFHTLTQPVLLLIWASWCLPCLEEIPFLRQHIAGETTTASPLALWGVCYKDTPSQAAHWLEQAHHPFSRLGMDYDGQCAIEWGVTGVPESFLILPHPLTGSRIVWHGTGSLTEALYREQIQPFLRGAL
ncbi:thioredoxin domain-containing protein [Bombella saccharophila]|uniref:Redoxin domain-containing protein n=1 Tax=Bombella saccharophila TaxID=2967338 RepID=A0ABT3W3V5_9PROT|nr:redoxin domain-containing protein [Bombella saccharophila]MCX5613731.1 redoxin domain-containing protein [Bombella saccharophila]PHI97501.1 hypothetical protein BG621_01725 [Parasaccharibacter apium]